MDADWFSFEFQRSAEAQVFAEDNSPRISFLHFNAVIEVQKWEVKTAVTELEREKQEQEDMYLKMEQS